MRNEKDRVYLKHIVCFINDIEEYLKDVNKSEFKKDKMLQDAVLRKLEIVGEATKNLSLSLRRKNGDVTWKQIAGTRDKLIHEYFGVDLDLVWEIYKKQLAGFKLRIVEILEGLN